MTIAGRFEDALQDVADGPLSGPELLPERLSVAAARMLPVDGAGLSIAGTGRASGSRSARARRTPSGPSGCSSPSAPGRA